MENHKFFELFKNTLLSRLYYMLYQINDLRVVVETAKRLLTKEQKDKDRTSYHQPIYANQSGQFQK